MVWQAWLVAGLGLGLVLAGLFGSPKLVALRFCLSLLGSCLVLLGMMLESDLVNKGLILGSLVGVTSLYTIWKSFLPSTPPPQGSETSQTPQNETKKMG